jgi:hypothetical protein
MKEKAANAKCVVLCYEECPAGGYAGHPVFARHGVRKGVNVYLTTNDPDRLHHLSGRKAITRKGEMEMNPLKVPILSDDDTITFKSSIDVIRIEASTALYYRRLWTHNFSGGAVSNGNHAILVDGKLAGIFGYDPMLMVLGKRTPAGDNALLLTYGMAVPNKHYRLGRLITLIALSKHVYRKAVPDIIKDRIDTVFTTMITKYPESKEMRGIMKLVRKQHDPKIGFKLCYAAPVKHEYPGELFQLWHQKESAYHKLKA